MNQWIASFFAGALFAVGLVVSGMTNPDIVISFLDVTGLWNPNLALVMGAALLTHGVLHLLITRRRSPLFDVVFHIPTRTDLTGSLVVGSALFGIGWGVSGMCPGPGIVSAFALIPEGAVFVVALIAGMNMHRIVEVTRGHSQ